MRKFIISFIILLLSLSLPLPVMSTGLMTAHDGLTGGTVGKLDGIDQCNCNGEGRDLQNKDACLVWDQSILKYRVYIYNSASIASESGSDVIAPDVCDGGAIGPGRWIESDSANIEEFFPSGTDPDVDTVGKVGRDTDDHSLRGYDGSIQYVYGQKLKTISVTINSPLFLEEADNLVIWENHTGFSFVITAIYSKSDKDNVGFTLKEMNDPHNYSDTTTIEVITISTNGTGVYYNDLTSGIDHTVIENTHAIAFDNDPTDDPDTFQIVIVGYLNGDVN